MKEKWKLQADTIADEIKHRPGQLIVVGVDNTEKADAFEKYWSEKHPHVEVLDRMFLNQHSDTVLMRVRLKGSVQ